MMVSTKGRYALMIMTYLAEHRQDGAVSLKDIAENNSMGIKYLEIIIASLNREGMVESTRGKKGGYRLVKEPCEYDLFSILKAAEGSLAPVACVEDGFCANAQSCKTRKMWLELDGIIEQYLSGKTLEDICE